MTKPGDRIECPGNKVGQSRRIGTVEEVHGSMLTIHWDSGERTTFTPTAGSLSVLAGARAPTGRTKKR